MRDNKAAVLFKVFLKASTFTFSGGIAMFPIIKRELCEKHHYMEDEEIVEMLALSQSLPGPIVLNLSIAAGKRIAGFRGVIAASIGVALPAFVLMLAVAAVLKVIPRDNPIINNVLSGIKAGSAAIIIAASWDLFVKSNKSLFAAAMLCLAIILIVSGVDILWIIMGAAISGIVYNDKKRN